MDHHFEVAARRLALVVSTWASLTLLVPRPRRNKNHEQPAPSG